MDVDSDHDKEISLDLCSVSTTFREGSKVLVDADVLVKITKTLERLTIQVEEMQTRIEGRPLQRKKIDKSFESRPRCSRRGAVRAKALNDFKVRSSNACDL